MIQARYGLRLYRIRDLRKDRGTYHLEEVRRYSSEVTVSRWKLKRFFPRTGVDCEEYGQDIPEEEVGEEMELDG